MTPLRDVPVAPGRLPLIGHAWRLAREPLRFVTDLYTSERTRGRLVRVELGRRPIYVLTDPGLIHQALVTQGNSFQRGAFFERVRPFLGEGLATLSGERHRRVRRLVQPAFSQAQLARYAGVVAEEAHQMAAAWRPGLRVALDEALDRLFIVTLAKVMFSPDLSPATVAEISRCLARITKAAVVRAVAPRPLTALPLGVNRAFDADAATMRGIVDDLIAARRESRQPPEDLLATLMAATDGETGATLDDRQVRDQVIAIMAGVENVGVVVTWAFHALAEHPEIKRRVEAEADAVTGGDPGRRVGHEQVAALEYTGRFLHEVTRLHALLLAMRRTTADVRLGETLLPAGTDIAYSQYGLHRDPVLYPQPDRLDPDRWLPEQAGRRPRQAFIPFGAGPQKCVGDSFAWAAMLITLATVVARWRLDPPAGAGVRTALAVIPKPRAMPMIVTPRRPPSVRLV